MYTGLSIKYVTLFFTNFDPPPPVTLCHTSRDPLKSTSHISDPPILSRPSTKNPDKSPSTNSLSIVHEGFCPGSFVWKVLSELQVSIFVIAIVLHAAVCQLA